MKYQYYTCDVFTETRFGGNPLAVFPSADGLSDLQMQQIAREFNLSETSFVFPPEQGHTRKVRIFTPTQELPFAGHPNVGTAFILASIGELGEIRSSLSVTFEEKAGLVPISIYEDNGKIALCELKAPEPLSLGKTLSSPLVASAVSLNEEDILTTSHQPQVASVGLPFLITELRDRAALQRARINTPGFDAILSEGVQPLAYLYTRSNDEVDIRARMFAPSSGVPEDPATGSATCAFVGLRTHLHEQESGGFTYRIAQGVEMGRPSILLGRADKVSGVVQATWVGGACVFVSEGFIQVD